MVKESKAVISPKQSSPSGQLSLAEQVIEPADRPFTEAARALLKAGFLLSNHPLRPNQAFDLISSKL